MAARVLCGMWLFTAVAHGQTIDAGKQAKVIDRIAREVRDGYVFPAMGKSVSDSLLARRARGAYVAPSAVRDFALAMTNELRALTKDKHMSLSPPAAQSGTPSNAARAPRRFIDSLSVINGIGYIRIGVFEGSNEAPRLISAAMTTLAPSYALIVDLRGCPGGSVPTFIELASYFVPPETTFGHVYSRQDNSETIFRTVTVKGPAYRDKPVFVLTDSATFSAAEAFAYHLKQEGRVRIVGDTSGGGAHRVRRVDVGEGFSLGLAYTRVVNARTGTDWEGVGVIPDIATPAVAADSVARAEAARTRR